MYDGITLGQYIPGTSFLHRLDPRSKLLAMLGLSMAVLLAQGIPALMFFIFLLAAAAAAARIPFSLLWRAWRPVLWLVLFVLLAHLAGTPGEPLARVGPLVLTSQGLLAGATAGLRLLLLVMGAALLTLTTRPLDLAEALGRLLSPANRLGLPAGEISLLLGLSLRFVPTLAEEANRITRAQACRGGGWEGGSLRERGQALVAMIIPLLVRSLRRADDLALAMAARCYDGGKNRTSLSTMRWRAIDTLVVAGSMLMIIWAVLGE